MSRRQLVDIAVQLQHETAKAWLVFDGMRTVWIAKSQAEFDKQSDNNGYGTLTLPEWLAKEKDLI